MTSFGKYTSWSTFALYLMVSLVSTLTLAAPPASSSADDYMGPKLYYRNRDTVPNTEDNAIPTLDMMGRQPPVQTNYEPNMYSIPAPSENALFNFLLSRRLSLGNRLRSYVDSNSNEVSRKRSYSKFCAFNAVSCFGRK